MASWNWLSSLVLAVNTAACTPTHNWREFVAPGTDLNVAFPCHPDQWVRTVVVLGARVPMTMLACDDDGVTFAISRVDMASPQGLGPALLELRQAAVTNVQGLSPKSSPGLVRGMTSNAEARRLEFVGRLPDGRAVTEHAVFFSRGLRVYQASAIGDRPAADLVEPFFAALRFQE